MEVLKIKYVRIMQHGLLITLHKFKHGIPALKELMKERTKILTECFISNTNMSKFYLIQIFYYTVFYSL